MYSVYVNFYLFLIFGSLSVVEVTDFSIYCGFGYAQPPNLKNSKF